MSESDKDRLRREIAEQRAAKQREIQERLNREADAERQSEERQAKLDRSFERGIEDLLGASAEEIKGAFSAPGDDDVIEVIREFNKAKAKGNNRRAEKIARKNKAKLRAHVKKNRGKGCLSVLIVMVGTGVALFGLSVWGAVEAVAAIF